ncbi:hypothetical protein [Deinococcus hopiensis]|uniref:Tetratricopeptide repeat-containing protein n=1 Tax=Deinococcus hopiensis KR-140 TaxID=695939 RepID=A0A1W1VBX9_9DEIO|nr:hypothetical protein [Deinococcus hopiensis]SMB90806.1 hypothetical protein SAMN00790413_00899 [Deinococcus hopiensis KR-140]
MAFSSASLNRLRTLVEAGEDTAALAALRALFPTEPERDGAAALALRLGQPRLALRWAAAPLLRAAALLRLGDGPAALNVLERQPETARQALLRARAAWQTRDTETAKHARHVRSLARAEGDAEALVAAATLLGEVLLGTDARAALRTLAEGLKVAELTGQEADAHLMAVLAHAQGLVGSGQKAARTAEKALWRSLPRSPARVVALLALGRGDEACAEAEAGELGRAWLEPFAELQSRSNPAHTTPKGT